MIPPMSYQPNDARYDVSDHWFRRCGRSGLMLPAISLGCWHNFGDAGTDPRKLGESDFHANAQAMLFAAFDHGITHFDLANNYGPAPGSAETRVGRILKEDFAGYRDELIISSKAGYDMWPGPYGEWGSRKYLIASCDQSLQRLGLDYVDIFYHHRPDPNTPIEESMGALDQLVRSGKALYVGISSYSPEQTRAALAACDENGFARPVIHQPSYSMLNRKVEDGLTEATGELGLGMIAFCPLAQGLLTGKYLGGVPADSRAKQKAGFLQESAVTPETVTKLNKLNAIAEARGQSLAQMALAWVLRPQGAGKGDVTTALIGASRPGQITENVKALAAEAFAADELEAIDAALGA